MKSPLMIAATTAALLSGTAMAEMSTPAEYRGYAACLEANEDAFRGLVPEREYLVSNTEESRTYYINATAWENGERVDVAFSCVTAKNGKLLQSQVALDTRYAAASDAIQVAGK
jgi:hypothetical protein